MLFLLWAMAFMGCGLVDDDTRDCGENCELDYEMQLVTNMNTELQTELTLAEEVAVIPALRQQLEPVFTDYAKDVNLSFYDVTGDSLRLYQEKHIMDASETYYNLFIPAHNYMHLGVANLEMNPSIGLEGDSRCHTAALRQPDRDTLESHQSGIFTARHVIRLTDDQDQSFDVHLYMANCATTLVLDTLGGNIRDVRVFCAGLATEFLLADSLYRFRPGTVVRALQAPTAEGLPLCFTTVSFPSREAPPSKAVIDADDPFVSEPSDEELWEIRVYTVLEDGSITQSLLGVYNSLRPGQYRIIKAHVRDDGSVVTKDPDVGVSITTKWKTGFNETIPL